MLIAEATVATDRPRRYLTQLCRHLTLVSQLHPQQRGLRRVVRRSRGDGPRLWPRHAPGRPWRPDLRAEAPDAHSLDLLQQRVATRLEQAGRRDGLAVTWRVAGVDNEWLAS